MLVVLQKFFSRIWLKLYTVVFVEKWALLGVPVKTPRNFLQGGRFRHLKWAWKGRFRVINATVPSNTFGGACLKAFFGSKPWATSFVCALPAEVLRKFYSAVWGWKRELLFNFKQHVCRVAIQKKLAFAAGTTSSDKELKVSNLLLDAKSKNKPRGKSVAATEYKDTIPDEDKQRLTLGNFLLCLQNAR